ncbi:DUF2254 domain-containing protein [Cribrihabitans neustonicus]|uniref:DUF2254 domain-containing protein n=1 Tax=Cribrihabitans neustonicus TaxID=1429085 RepID=UPI003B5A684B
MNSRPLLLLRRITRQLWFRVVLISLFSLIALAVAPLLAPVTPGGLADRIGRDAVLPVLTILASSMLAVTTFSLNVMVSAYRTASSMATPRVYRLLLEDTVTHSVLATFTGGFVYALCAIILFRAGAYTPEATIVVFGITVLVVVLIVGAILRWIDHLSGLGSMDHTLRLIEQRTRTALGQRARKPCLGGARATGGPPEDARPILARQSGFVRFADIAALNELAEKAGAEVVLHRGAGEYVLRNRAVAWARGGDEKFCTAAAKLIDIGDVRSFDQDPSFGLTLLAETALKALSPGINDPGTAIEVMGRIERLLWENFPDDGGDDEGDDGAETEPGPPQAGTRGERPGNAGADRAEDGPEFPRIFVPPVTAGRLLDSAFPPIARCGADDPEVMAWMDKALRALEGHPNSRMAAAAGKMRRRLTAPKR